MDKISFVLPQLKSLQDEHDFARIQTNKSKILIDFLQCHVKQRKSVAIGFRWEMVRSAQHQLLVCIYLKSPIAAVLLGPGVKYTIIED